MLLFFRTGLVVRERPFSCRFLSHDHENGHHISWNSGDWGGVHFLPSFFCTLLCRNGLPALAWRFNWCLCCCPLPISSPPRTSFFVCCDQLGVVREHVLLLISCVTIQTLWGHANACNRGHLLAHPRVEWVYGEEKRRHYSNLLVALLSPHPPGCIRAWIHCVGLGVSRLPVHNQKK